MDTNFFTLNIFNRELIIDKIMREWLLSLSSPWLDQFFKSITYLGSALAFIILGLLAFILLTADKKRLEGIFLIVCMLSSWLTMLYLKSFFGRVRPVGEQLIPTSGFSFPSGHAMVSMAFYGFLAYILLIQWPGKRGRRISAFLYMLILLIGISRVYLNVHYASDVLAGFFAGGMILLIFIKVLKRVKRKYPWIETYKSDRT